MGFIEDTIVKAKDVIGAAGEKGTEILNIQKLKIEAAKIESQISKDFETLGRVVYSNIKNDVAADDGINGIIEVICEKQAALEIVHRKLSDEKGLAICSECGANNASDSAYCSKCGAPLHK